MGCLFYQIFFKLYYFNLITICILTELNPTNPPPAYLVYGGLEPARFTNLFPCWSTDISLTEMMLNVCNLLFELNNLYILFHHCKQLFFSII